MPHDIIDNRHEKLLDHIQRILPGSHSARFAVGYFFLSGLEAVAGQLANVKELRLLIGNTSSRETIEQIAEGYRRLEQVQNAAEAQTYPKRAEAEAARQQTAQAVGETVAFMDQTAQAEELVSVLVRLIQAGRLKVRVYTKGRLHAKAYIFDYGPLYDAQGQLVPREERGIAIVGSSNFTLSGVSSNTELNVLVPGNANHAELTRWFEELWKESPEFEEQLLVELEQAWPRAQVTPYEIYLKTLYELCRDRLEGEQADQFLWADAITSVLTEFQEDAVRRAVRIIRQYGGCFVADVVGLGKSYIGAAIIKHFERQEDARPLIVCPAALVRMWERYNEAYQLNARVLSMGLLREDDQHGPEWMLHDALFRDRDFVLLDESHNFRHTDNQRYRVLQSYLSGGDRRCVFLTATPRNKSAWDIYHQLRLFHPGELTDIPIDPPNLREYFRLVEGGERRLPGLLSHLLIRRTRNHILRWYGFDEQTDQRVDADHFAPYRQGQRRAYVLVGGKKQFFPKRELQTVEYSIEATYGGLYEQLRGYLGRPLLLGASPDAEQLTYARYGLWDYVRREKRTISPYTELHHAGANLRGLMRVMLFKRFESSVQAFRETVRRLLRIHSAFLAALQQGIVPAGEEAQSLLYESDQDEEQALVDALALVCGRYELEDFDADSLHRDIEHDIAILRRVLALVEPITAEEDAKLQTLLAWLSRQPLAEGKRLIFTQYADTAKYLFENLNPDGQRQDIEVAFSSGTDKAEIVGRFAPRANPEQRPPDGAPEIQTLISTDVLAEGLNLQDCNMVVNYDLHWNPVRLIQRLGRVDRIGTEYERIHAYNFLPETRLEENLGLREKLAQRIREIHETIGEDAAILDPTERLNEKAMYAIYSDGDLSSFDADDEDELVDLHEAEEIMRQLQQDQPDVYERITHLRDGIRTAKLSPQEGSVVFCRAGRYRQLYLVGHDGEILSRDVPSILGLLKCEPATPPALLPPHHNEGVMGVRRQFDAEVQARRAERDHTLALSKAQRYVLRELRSLYGETEDGDVRGQIAVLEAAFRQPNPRPVVQRFLNGIRREGLMGMALFHALSGAYRAYGLSAAPRQEEECAEENDELPRVVCSEGLVNAQSGLDAPSGGELLAKDSAQL